MRGVVYPFPTTEQTVCLMSNPTPFEQLMLEFINQARMDPQGEYERFIISSSPVQAIEQDITQALNYFSVDLAVYQEQLADLNPVAPLAGSRCRFNSTPGN